MCTSFTWAPCTRSRSPSSPFIKCKYSNNAISVNVYQLFINSIITFCITDFEKNYIMYYIGISDYLDAVMFRLTCPFLGMRLCDVASDTYRIVGFRQRRFRVIIWCLWILSTWMINELCSLMQIGAYTLWQTIHSLKYCYFPDVCIHDLLINTIRELLGCMCYVALVVAISVCI